MKFLNLFTNNFYLDTFFFLKKKITMTNKSQQKFNKSQIFLKKNDEKKQQHTIEAKCERCRTQQVLTVQRIKCD